MNEVVHEEHKETEFCTVHPNTEAKLRCNRCERLMCTRCAVHTPTGYRCKECVRGQQKVFITAKTQDYIIGPLVAGFLSLIGGLILPRFWIYFIVLGAPLVGSLIAEVTRRVVDRRRAKTLYQASAAAVLIGGLLPVLLPITWSLLSFGFPGFLQLLGAFGSSLLWQLIYAGIAAATTYYRLSGLRL